MPHQGSGARQARIGIGEIALADLHAFFSGDKLPATINGIGHIMIIRQALFEGRIHQGKEAAFKAYVADKLMPMWLRFPGVREVRVLYALERDEGAPAYPMVLSTMYDSTEALAEALDSPVRYESREMTKGLLAMFDGVIHHHVFDLMA